MKTRHLKRKTIRTAVKLALICGASNSFANPTGLTVSLGSASTQQSGSQLNVTVSQLAILNWSTFNIAAGETTTFLQPSSGSIVFNVIGDANPSQIFGNLNANGTVILANANGLYFGPNSMIKVGGSFIATTAALPPDAGSGSSWQFSGMPPLASIVNYGQIQVGQGQSLFLIAEDIENHGALNAPAGNVELAAGQTVLVSQSADGRGLSAQVQLPQGTVDNFGNITADAGTIALQAQVVNENGIVQADSVQNQGGVIELTASDNLTLGASSQISANGDASSGGSIGGTVTLQSGDEFSDSAGSQISATGGALGGMGGSIAVSAPNLSSFVSTLNAGAQAGWSGGAFSLDTANITLGNSTAIGALVVSTEFASFSDILLQASGNLALNPGTSWNLSTSTGESAGQLTLEAGGNITLGNSSKILDANSWAVTLHAGYDFGANAIQPGTGNIDLSGGSGTIQLGAGSIDLFAGENILVGSGSIFTTGGGGIFADAVSGDVNAGTSNGSGTTGVSTSDYLFGASGAKPNAILGGISTKAGGDVTLIAGDDITSVPVVPTKQWPGASGAYGAGDVTLIAGNQITGNYNLANGAGNIFAGVSAAAEAQAAQELQNPANDATALGSLPAAVMQNTSGNGNIGTSANNGGVTLSLIQGSWNAWAANNIYVKEVNNPNGVFNSNPNNLNVFTYAADAAANFWAGNAINLVGGTIVGANPNMPLIYAPILTLNAGAGGITMDDSIVLYPSAEGELQITTRAGGNLTGAVSANSTLTGITMSDSGSANWQTFVTGHAITPLYYGNANPDPVVLNIAGSIESFGLTVPTFATINVTGNTYNFGFSGQNVSPNQTTSIDVKGSITYRGDLTSQTLSSAITASQFADIISGDPSLAGALSYDPTTGTISYVGVMGAATEQSLQNPTDANQNAILTGSSLAAWQSAISALYASTQNASLGDNGLALAGPGQFNITANSIDLGISGGISVLAPDSALASISPDGADISVTTSGNLEMTTSVVANDSLLGGVNLNVGGTLDVGGGLTPFGDPDSPKGIFTTSGGNISVTAGGNINLDGSRIAAYDGGDMTIESLNGDVDAGTGGAGYVTLEALQLDPVTEQLTSISATIPGSGILATTVANSDATLGNILVETPNGNISASQGGVVQISFNNTDASAAAAFLLAGYELRDPTGRQRLTVSDISGQDSLLDNGAGATYAASVINGTGTVIGELAESSPDENINASGSGVIAQNIIAKATGEDEGFFVGLRSVDLDADRLDHVFVIAPIVTSLGSQTTPIIGISDNSNGQMVAPTTEAPAAQVAPTAATAVTVTSKTDNPAEDENRKKDKPTALAQKVSRVTVTLPQKHDSENPIPNPSL
jgi:filamentous hemagglutinin family protein